MAGKSTRNIPGRLEWKEPGIPEYSQTGQWLVMKSGMLIHDKDMSMMSQMSQWSSKGGQAGSRCGTVENPKK